MEKLSTSETIQKTNTLTKNDVSLIDRCIVVVVIVVKVLLVVAIDAAFDEQRSDGGFSRQIARQFLLFVLDVLLGAGADQEAHGRRLTLPGGAMKSCIT